MSQPSTLRAGEIGQMELRRSSGATWPVGPKRIWRSRRADRRYGNSKVQCSPKREAARIVAKEKIKRSSRVWVILLGCLSQLTSQPSRISLAMQGASVPDKIFPVPLVPDEQFSGSQSR
eukprot:1799513-Karenia_brevis.AAC.1